jgi:hypothetical protein
LRQAATNCLAALSTICHQTPEHDHHHGNRKPFKSPHDKENGFLEAQVERTAEALQIVASIFTDAVTKKLTVPQQKLVEYYAHSRC